MHRNTASVERRIERFAHDYLREKYWVQEVPVRLEAWQAPDEPVPVAEALQAGYSPIFEGAAWGTPWSTMWLHVVGEVPVSWPTGDNWEPEFVLDLDFTPQPGFQAEGLVFTPSGDPIKAINPLNRHVPLRAGQPVEFYIECAANPNIGDFTYFPETDLGAKHTAPQQPLYSIERARIMLRDKTVWELEQDYAALQQLMEVLPAEAPRRHEIRCILEEVLDQADPTDIPCCAGKLREILRPALAKPAAPSALTMIATGHAHIDTAWLWPIRETKRKCARTFSNVCDLLEQYPDFVFSCSSAQQLAWMKESYPAIWERIKRQVEVGRFLPVGGMWVESDGNLPGGESLVRQFVAGKRFFLEEFGIETKEAWLPDSFGYSGALPQITKLAGNRYFLTQKVSWNELNVFPHHTFRWEGIDGSAQFTHFPPADTYNSDFSGHELAHFERNFKEKGRATIGMGLFGYGDGGGGPTREMLAAAQRKANLEGSPRVQLGSATEFFTAAEAEYHDIPTWVGELYLELHRGTLSAQLRTKQGNRRAEHALRQAELWAAYAAVLGRQDYPYDQLETVWHRVLLLQFHDILPGSSIAWVHEEAEADYEHIVQVCESIIETSVAAVVGAGDRGLIANAGPVRRNGVAPLGISLAVESADELELRSTAGGFQLGNALVRLEVDETGRISSLRDAASGRETISAGEPAAGLYLHPDIPSQWDAWELEEHYRHTGEELTAPTALESFQNEGTVGVRATYRTGESTITKTIAVEADSPAVKITLDLDWHEKKKVLKLGFPLDLRAAEMASEIQFGHLRRPVPVNTSWDFARFETCAHRWVHLAEGSYGVAIANDSSYGHDVSHHVRADGATTTVPRVTIIRAPGYPDPRAEEGQHQVQVSVRPGAEIAAAVEEGYRINLPLRKMTGAKPAEPLVTVSSPQVMVEAVKLAEDRSGDLVVRLYEATGARANTTVRVAVPGTGVTEVDLLERDFPAAETATRTVATAPGNEIDLVLRPFEIKTLRFQVQ